MGKWSNGQRKRWCVVGWVWREVARGVFRRRPVTPPPLPGRVEWGRGDHGFRSLEDSLALPVATALGPAGAG